MTHRMAARPSQDSGIPHARASQRPPHRPWPVRAVRRAAASLVYALTMAALTAGALVMLRRLDR